MACSKIKKILFILLCCFILIFPFWCVAGYCEEVEEVSTEVVLNLGMNPRFNYFYTTSSNRVLYAELEKGYIYHVTNPSTVFSSYIAFSSDIPANNVPYYDFMTLDVGETYNFVSNDYNYIYISGMDRLSLTREPVAGMSNAVGGLVSSVGIDNIWGVFDISINYILIAVVVALGLFIIFKLIRKLTKGKEGF